MTVILNTTAELTKRIEVCAQIAVRGAKGDRGARGAEFGTWLFDASSTDVTVGVSPPEGKMRLNSGAFNTTTVITIDHLDFESNEETDWLASIRDGDTVDIRTQSTPEVWAKFKVETAAFFIAMGVHYLILTVIPHSYSTGFFESDSLLDIGLSRKGDKGDQGEQGDAGDQGIQGVKGDKGDTGDQGIQGIQGLKGDKGDTGDAGETGATGSSGSQIRQSHIKTDWHDGVMIENGTEIEINDDSVDGILGSQLIPAGTLQNRDTLDIVVPMVFKEGADDAEELRIRIMVIDIDILDYVYSPSMIGGISGGVPMDFRGSITLFNDVKALPYFFLNHFHPVFGYGIFFPVPSMGTDYLKSTGIANYNGNDISIKIFVSLPLGLGSQLLVNNYSMRLIRHNS